MVLVLVWPGQIVIGKRGKVVAEEVVVGSRAFLPSVRTWTLSSDSGGAGKVFSRERRAFDSDS